MDFMTTKGTEYLLLIGYLLVLIPFWILLRGRAAKRAPATAAARRAVTPRSWFEVPADRHYHRGHAWALPEGDRLLRVGVDDFARKLVGRPDAVRLPALGARVEAGAPAWKLELGGEAVDVLSPVTGEIAEVNPEVLSQPGLVADDPYGRGWLFKVRVPQARSALKNLLPSRLAKAWTEEASERVMGLMGMTHPELGVVLQDGGVPVAGIARELAPAGWRAVAAEFLLTA
jgi:glycine cleavage system H lipoate-binding protein